MGEEIRYYKGKHRVRVLTKSQGNWIVETLEPFEDILNGQEVKVKTGERRIVVPNLLFRRQNISPPVSEHAYELKMEKRLKQLVQKKKQRIASKAMKIQE
jgi:hypothetical protein